MPDPRFAVQYLNVARVVVDSDAVRFECAFNAHSASLSGSARTWLIEEQRPDKGKPCWHCTFTYMCPLGGAEQHLSAFPTPPDCRS